jgi:hypothetical protein
MCHSEKLQLASLLTAVTLPEIKRMHAGYPEQMSKALYLLEMLPTVLEDVFNEIAAINETNERAAAGRRELNSRFGILDSYEFTSATAHLGEFHA